MMDNMKTRDWTLVKKCFTCKGKEKSGDTSFLMAIRQLCNEN